MKCDDQIWNWLGFVISRRQWNHGFLNIDLSSFSADQIEMLWTCMGSWESSKHISNYVNTVNLCIILE